MNHLNICSSCFRGGGDGFFVCLFISFYLKHELLEHLFFLFLLGGGGGGGGGKGIKKKSFFLLPILLLFY